LTWVKTTLREGTENDGKFGIASSLPARLRDY
jgi:hypothetical protein